MSEAVEEASTEVEGFLDFLFEGQSGYVYVPIKTVGSEHWQEYYFKWPQHKNQIASHLLIHSAERDCYVSPSLFKAPSSKRNAWKGSNFVWVEFDGNAPRELPEGIPSPSLRIQSSNSKHEHWYWRLSTFEVDHRALEGLTGALAYTLDADKSGWECNQVLRPPGTIHQESRKRVRILAQADKTFSYSSFKNLVTPPQPAILETNFSELPDVTDVVAKYRWPKEATELYKKKSQPVGSRSSAMTKLGFYCIEMGMSNDEAYVVLLNADERWGKYRNRPPADRARRLIGIISHCRGKKELDAELNLSERESFVSIGDFRKTTLKAKWLFNNLITEKGLGIISAAPGVGKTTLSLRFGISSVLGKNFLVWSNAGTKGTKVGFVSLEMAGVECKKFIEDMWPSLSTEEQELVDANFFLLPLGYSLPLASRDAQQMIMDEVDKHDIKILIIDSLKAATSLDERKLDAFFDWVNKHLRERRGCTVWLIHHNRKPANEGPRKPRGLEDLYGDTFITAHPTTVVSLWRRSKTVLEVIPLKIRLAEETDPFRIGRTEHLDFTVLDDTVDRHEEESNDLATEDDNGNSGFFK